MISEELFFSLPSDGWLEKDEADWLAESARNTEGVILEVGCYYGRSTVLLASLGRRVISVDPFVNFNTCDMSGEVAKQAWRTNMMSRGITNTELFVCKIEEWEGLPIGFAYLDGDHTFEGTVRQIEAALQWNPTEICVHDYDVRQDGLKIKLATETFSQLQLVSVVREMARFEVKQ